MSTCCSRQPFSVRIWEIGTVLEDLDKIDWHKYQQGTKPVDIPRLLRNFVSGRNQTRISSFRILEEQVTHSHIYHGGGSVTDALRTELPILIVPFLIELLGYAHVQGKDLLLLLLEDIAHYVDFEPEEPYRARAQQAYEAVCEGFDTYVSLLGDQSSKVRIGAIGLLYTCGANREVEIARLLLNRLETEDQSQAKTQIVLAIGDILNDGIEVPGDVRSRFQSMLLSIVQRSSSTGVEDRNLRGISALCIAELTQPDVPHEILALFPNEVFDFATTSGIPNLLQRLCRVLVPVGGDVAIPILLDFLDRIRVMHYPMLAMLDIVFGENRIQCHQIMKLSLYDINHRPENLRQSQLWSGKRLVIFDPNNPDMHPFSPPEHMRKTLTEEQRSLLKHLADSDRVWEFESNVFKLYDLPSTREELRALLNSDN